MTIISHFIGYLREQFMDAVLDQQRTSQYTHDLKDRSSKFEVVFNDCDKAVCDNGNVYLYPHRILAVAPETFDAKMLLDSFEEKLDLPAVAVEEGNVFRRKIEVVCVVHKGASQISRIIDNPAQFRRVISGVAPACKSDCLIKEHAVNPVQQVLAVDNLKLRLPLLSDNKECPKNLYFEKPRQVKISAVENITGVGFIGNPVHRLGIMLLGGCNPVENRYLGNDVNLRMDTDAGFGTAEVRPTEDGHAEVDCGGIHSVETSVKFKFSCDSPLLGERHHVERKFLENPGVAKHVCLCKGAPNNSRVSKSELVAPLGMGCRDVCEFRETSASDKLAENEDKHVAPMGKSPVLRSVFVFCDDSPESTLRKENRNLCKNVLSFVHPCSLLTNETRKRISSLGQYFPIIKNCA